MKISVFGNEDLGFDSTPIKILPELKDRFQDFEFAIEDPNELSEPDTDTWVIIDTVKNLKQVQEIGIGDLKKTKNRVSVHDFDLGAHLFWIKKINPVLKIKIIGIPPTISEKQAVEEVSNILSNLLPGNGKRN
jgi:hypothetical protein